MPKYIISEVQAVDDTLRLSPKSLKEAIHLHRSNSHSHFRESKKVNEPRLNESTPSLENCATSQIIMPTASITEVEHNPNEVKSIPLFIAFTTYLTFFLMLFYGRVREFYRYFFPVQSKYPPRPGYAPLVKDFDDFWQRRFYRRIRDCWNRPIDSRPSRAIGVMERVSYDRNVTYEYTGKIIPAVNLGSYNYLGFAEDLPSITHDVLHVLDRFGTASCSAAQELGQHSCLRTLEREFADFLKKEDAIICGMGFGTNFRGLPSLFGKDTLVISDHLNHSSLVNGVRSSGAKVRVFRHDNYTQLEQLIREGIILGRNPTGPYLPWKSIVIIVEGIYSMEGEIVDLKRIVELKKKYNALLFVDEAHSIGAIGQTGRGVCEHTGVDPKDVDILMGTFTKSFGSIGGYIATNKKIIDHMRAHSSIALHCDTLAPPCTQQVISVLNVLLGKDGSLIGLKRIQQLKENARFLRQGLINLGLIVLGDNASPVIPLMLYNLGKLASVSRKCLERGVAVVVVGYPATPLLEGRVRFCVSASHTRDDLQYVLDVLKDISEEIYITYNKKAIKG